MTAENYGQLNRGVRRMTQNLLSSFVALYHTTQEKRIAALEASYKMLEDSYGVYKDKVIRKYSANNWLKMHGYQMRRRAR